LPGFPAETGKGNLTGIALRPQHVSSPHLGDDRPERLSLPVRAALCDIFEVTAGHLIATTAQNTPVCKTAGGGGEITGLSALRRRRAQPWPRRAQPWPRRDSGPVRRDCARCGRHGFPAASASTPPSAETWNRYPAGDRRPQAQTPEQP
jgi:hypothetical protein